jgi:4-amino-4-deoxy-L-arabinose transferase-like glycosyltransferase
MKLRSRSMIAETPPAPRPGPSTPNRARRAARLRDPRLLLLAVTAVGAGDFLWRLGSSSFFVDEVLSIDHALPSFGMITHVVSTTETTPWTYFWGLHIWLYFTGWHTQWVARLPSALIGVALVVAVYWMARAFVGRWAALLAALLTALSPLVVTYAQQVRVYVFVLLALTVAVALTVRAVPERPHRTRRLVLGATAAVLALWLHYTAAFVVAPLCVWLAMQGGLSRRARLAFAGVCLAGFLAELPLFVRQYHYAPNGGIGPTGRVSGLNVVKLFETPFDGRYAASVNAFRIIALIAVVSSVFVLAAGARGKLRQPRLLVALGMTAPLAILILGLAGKDVVITRYTAVAAPLLLTGLAAAVSSLPRLPGALLAGLAASAAIWGVVSLHERTGFDAPARETIAFINAHARPGAVLALPGHPGADIPLGYYIHRDLHPVPAVIEATDHKALVGIFRQRRPLWLMVERNPFTTSPAALRRFLDRILTPYRYSAALVKPITTSTTFVIELLTPGSGTAPYPARGAP